jgi:hypothetical protein
MDKVYDSGIAGISVDTTEILGSLATDAMGGQLSCDGQYSILG